jgi:hypothetical protein
MGSNGGCLKLAGHGVDLTQDDFTPGLTAGFRVISDIVPGESRYTG